MYTCPWCGTASDHEYLKVQDYFLSHESFSIMECDSCHLLFTAPRPASSSLGAYYKSENYYSHQENKHGFIPRLYEAVKTFNLKNKVNIATAGLPKGSVLDIGCGVGDFLCQMQHNDWNITGIEPDSDARAIAFNRLNRCVFTPQNYDLFDDSSFDLITMWHVLEHVEDLHFQIHELQRLLKPGGRLLLALPNFQSFDALHYQQYWAAWDVPRHLNHFSSDTIRSIVCSLSFQFIDCQKLRWDSYYISYLSESYMHHSLPLFRGFIRGFQSNCKALSTGMYSSLVYRFQKI